MKVFVDWVLARRERVVILAVVSASLLPMVTAGLLALETAQRGVAKALVSAGFGVAALVVLGLVSGGSPAMFATIGLLTFLPGVAIGALIRWAGNLVLAFQATVLAAVVLVVLLSLAGPAAESLFEPSINETVELLAASGVAEEQLQGLRETGARMLLNVMVFWQLMLPLFLGYWWFALAKDERTFGAEFRALKLGRMLGITATIFVALGMLLEVRLVENVAVLALWSFLLQGLAVMHAWAFAKRWGAALLAPVYMALVVFPFGLSTVGLVDNWFNLRAARSRA